MPEINIVELPHKILKYMNVRHAFPKSSCLMVIKASILESEAARVGYFILQIIA